MPLDTENLNVEISIKNINESNKNLAHWFFC